MTMTEARGAMLEADTGGVPTLAARRRREGGASRAALVVLLFGAIVTVLLTVSSRVGYVHNEQRLTGLETQLTGSALGGAQVDLERRLGQAAGLAAIADDPVATFRTVIAPSLAPKGPFITSSLVLLKGGRAAVLAHLGVPVIGDPNSAAALANDTLAAKTNSLIVARAVTPRQQRLVLLMAARGMGDSAYVVTAAEALPADRRVVVPASSPDAGLNIAIYFGNTTASPALLEATVAQVPLAGTTSRTTVPFGNHVLTLVASSKGSLAGSWAEFLPWGILAVGALFSVGIAAMTERLVRRQRHAEDLAVANRALYREQRNVSVTLQRSLLPKVLPEIEGVELAARYIPGSTGVEIGGDWYSAIAVDDRHFTFVIGDVSGHGIMAAAVMASLRYTTRTLARLGQDPASILKIAARELSIDSDQHFATVLVGHADLDRRELVLASAGHLDPVLDRDGVVGFVKVPTGVPIGLGSEDYAIVTLPITAGMTLVLFTDGLVERRGEILDEGLERVRARVSAGAESIDGLVGSLVEELSGGRADDDTAVLGIRWLS
ncbi:MAG TPA: PP2C family protein-serine/threonine phosphatase [Acidimicrobiales bacterium]|nr:PP2C family protein-serine/threonine phosphatase [Acidimicrobiales bacterium]